MKKIDTIILQKGCLLSWISMSNLTRNKSVTNKMFAKVKSCNSIQDISAGVKPVSKDNFIKKLFYF